MTLLRQVELFAGLDAGRRAQVAALARLVSYTDGQPILRQGEAIESLFVLIEGHARVFTSSPGPQPRQENIALLRAGEVFGEMSLVDRQAPSASVVAEGQVTACAIDKAALTGLLARDREMAAAVLWSLCQILVRRMRRSGETLSAARAMLNRCTRGI